MTELLTAAQMRAIEQAAIASGEVTGLELMERAGAGVVEAILEEWPEMALTSQKAVVLCGPGNNGGDGFVVARLLKQRGWEVEVFLDRGEEGLSPNANTNCLLWLKIGYVTSIRHFVKNDSFSREENPDGVVIIDALFGTGLNRSLPENLSDIARHLLPWLGEFSVSIDSRSGVCSDSGRLLSSAQTFDTLLVVTFHTEKVGHRLNLGWWHKAAPRVVDIGLHGYYPDSYDCNADVRLISKRDIWDLGDPIIAKHSANHKYHHGHALILSGPSAHTGAARLAARGALRIGAGVVSLGAPQSAITECAAQLTAIMLAPIEDGVALEATLQDQRINALCLGPALGLDERAEGLLEAAIGGVKPHSTVLDADALTILARRPDLFAKLHKNCILTPHAGEFKRLFPEIIAKLDAPALTGPAYSKVDATREAAALAGCVVLFKGADTVIAAPDGRAAINSAHYERAAPWLATAGSGDVLAGFITGLLARGFTPMQAAETAAWLHVESALHFGPGLIAEDLPEQLPAVFKALSL